MSTNNRLIRTEVIKVRVSKQMKAELAAVAESQGRSASEVARQALIRWLRHERRAA